MNKIAEFVANNWVSWVLEVTVMGVIAFYTISENQKTQEQTRQMISNFEASITAYASDKSKAIDDAALAAKEEVKKSFQTPSFIQTIKDRNLLKQQQDNDK